VTFQSFQSLVFQTPHVDQKSLKFAFYSWGAYGERVPNPPAGGGLPVQFLAIVEYVDQVLCLINYIMETINYYLSLWYSKDKYSQRLCFSITETHFKQHCMQAPQASVSFMQHSCFVTNGSRGAMYPRYPQLIHTYPQARRVPLLPSLYGSRVSLGQSRQGIQRAGRVWRS